MPGDTSWDTWGPELDLNMLLMESGILLVSTLAHDLGLQSGRMGSRLVFNELGLEIIPESNGWTS